MIKLRLKGIIYNGYSEVIYNKPDSIQVHYICNIIFLGSYLQLNTFYVSIKSLLMLQKLFRSSLQVKIIIFSFFVKKYRNPAKNSTVIQNYLKIIFQCSICANVTSNIKARFSLSFISFKQVNHLQL